MVERRNPLLVSRVTFLELGEPPANVLDLVIAIRRVPSPLGNPLTSRVVDRS